MKKSKTILTIIFFVFPSVLLAQEVIDMNLKVRLATELLSKDLISQDEIRILNYEELKHKCSIPLSFGIYKYDFHATHMRPGLFILDDRNLTVLTNYEYQKVFNKMNLIFESKDLEYKDRLFYLAEIFKTLQQRYNSGYEVIPDSLFDPNAELDYNEEIESADSTNQNK